MTCCSGKKTHRGHKKKHRGYCCSACAKKAHRKGRAKGFLQRPKKLFIAGLPVPTDTNNVY